LKVASGDLVSLAKSGDCNFYKKIEDIKKCGPNGYPLAYGGKYCEKFGLNYNNFNTDVILVLN
jgi:hypothetical protein